MSLLSSQLEIHNTRFWQSFCQKCQKGYVTIGDVKIPFELIYQLREIFKVGTLLSAKTTLHIVIGIFLLALSSGREKSNRKHFCKLSA